MLVASASAGRLGLDPGSSGAAPLRGGGGPPGAAPAAEAPLLEVEVARQSSVGLDGPGARAGAGAGAGGGGGEAPACPCACPFGAPSGEAAAAAAARLGGGGAAEAEALEDGRGDTVRHGGRAGPLRLKSINHISRACSSVPAATAFYRDVLGFLEVKRPPSFDFEGSWLFGYGIGVHLIHGQPVRREAEIDPRADHLSFQCDSMAEVEDRLKHWGTKYVKEIILEGPAKVQQLFFHDPDNNMIEICNCECLLSVAGFEV